MMIIENSLKVKNYKCFGEEEQGFEKICPINIIIGKNNSGKSSLIDLVEYSINTTEDILETKFKFSKVKCIVGLEINDDILKEVANHYTNFNVGGDPIERLAKIKNHVKNYFGDTKILFELSTADVDTYFLSTQNDYSDYKSSFVTVFKSFFRDKNFRRINAERDILPENRLLDNIKNNGDGATSIVWKHLSIMGYDQDLIKKEFLLTLKKIINPDIDFVDIMIKEENNLENKQQATGEIYFEVKNGTWVALSKMGSGVKTVILVLLNLIVIPKFKYSNKENLVFGFEELENNLHPSLLKRLFNYITEYSEKNNAYFFITTHSSIVIDLYGGNKNAQIIHVENVKNSSVCRTVNTSVDGRSILKDLDYKPSDLLLSNGIIWVEGPSDAIYLELVLELYKREFADTFKSSFCIQSLSTAIWKYAGFKDFDWSKMTSIENKLISLAKLNHNHIIVIDNDGNYEDLKPSNWKDFNNGNGQNKARLIHESMSYANHSEDILTSNYGDTADGKLFFWINDGTFETYLENFINDKGISFSKYFHKPGDKYFEKKRTGTNSAKSKVELAAEIAQFVLESNCSIYDIAPKNSSFFSKVQKLSKTIKGWNY